MCRIIQFVVVPFLLESICLKSLANGKVVVPPVRCGCHFHCVLSAFRPCCFTRECFPPPPSTRTPMRFPDDNWHYSGAGRLANLLRESGPSRIEECEEACQRWVDRLQTKIGNQYAGTDEDLAKALGGLVDVLEEQVSLYMCVCCNIYRCWVVSRGGVARVASGGNEQLPLAKKRKKKIKNCHHPAAGLRTYLTLRTRREKRKNHHHPVAGMSSCLLGRAEEETNQESSPSSVHVRNYFLESWAAGFREMAYVRV